MKFLLILSSLILGTIAIDQSFLEAARSKIKKKLVECIDEEHSSQSDLDEILALHVPASHEGKCAIFCTHKKFDLQHEDGSINQEGALETFEIIKEVDEEFYQKWVNVFNSCSSSTGDSDPCVNGANLFECILRESQAAGIHDLIVE